MNERAIIPIHNPLQKKLTFKSGLIFDDYRNNMLEHGLIFKQAIINWLRRPASSGSGGVNQLSTPGAGYLAGHRSLKSRCRPNGEIYYGLSEKKGESPPPSVNVTAAMSYGFAEHVITGRAPLKRFAGTR